MFLLNNFPHPNNSMQPLTTTICLHCSSTAAPAQCHCYYAWTAVACCHPAHLLGSTCSCFIVPCSLLQKPSGLQDVYENFPKWFAEGYRGKGHEVCSNTLVRIMQSG
eukprot:GHRQ01011404.1.p3 GENE.GHRQ01011404.1~~GHRQ01011404.1.p3  ORF type:complete len:107 (+),score=22.18 GHRQ01011404.1:615-935(+)